MNSAEVHIWNHEKLHKNNGKCLRNSRKWLFLKIRFIMQLRFLILWFSSVLVFSVLYYWNKNPCFNAQAVAQKQLKMLENWKISFSKMRFIMQMNNWVFWGWHVKGLVHWLRAPAGFPQHTLNRLHVTHHSGDDGGVPRCYFKTMYVCIYRRPTALPFPF